MRLAEQDKDIVIALSEKILYGKNFTKTYKSRKPNIQATIGLYLVNKKLSDALSKQGCLPNKTFILKFPQIDKTLIRHFIRGYFDGDGMLSITYRYYKKSLKQYSQTTYSITTTIEMIKKIMSEFKELGVYSAICKRWKNRNNNNYTLRVCSKYGIRKICDWMYKDATIFGKRKYGNYLKLIELTNN